MPFFLLLLGKLVPLYLIIGLGYLGGKFLNAQKETVAALLIYIIAPVVVFDGVLRADLTASILVLPLFFLTTCSLLCFAWYRVGAYLWADATRNIFAFTAGTGNTGYFGLPVALAVLGPEYLSPVVLSTLGFLLYENTVGFFVTARGHHTVQESLHKVSRLPTVYAFVLALLAHALPFPLGENYQTVATSFRGAYSVLGMMIIGLGLADIQKVVFDGKFLGLTFAAKFIVWPLWIFLAILLDEATFGLFSNAEQKTMILMAIVPLAANTVAFASALRAEPEKASLAVLLSTLFALFFIPAIASVFFV